ncbi:hypothetical protein [Micromonospora sp. NPDC049033]|uniref:hypothetical protein n=1 Tax=Micromonospora sp. NPDC049033 TaxID=3155149 RepID=UPI0033C8211B
MTDPSVATALDLVAQVRAELADLDRPDVAEVVEPTLGRLEAALDRGEPIDVVDLKFCVAVLGGGALR